MSKKAEHFISSAAHPGALRSRQLRTGGRECPRGVTSGRCSFRISGGTQLARGFSQALLSESEIVHLCQHPTPASSRNCTRPREHCGSVLLLCAQEVSLSNFGFLSPSRQVPSHDQFLPRVLCYICQCDTRRTVWATDSVV
jgi:hypothetical protein